jgi:hypothetical protein
MRSPSSQCGRPANSSRRPARRPGRTARHSIHLLLAGLLGVAAAVLVASCGSSGKGLIPAAQAGPLKSDFELVAQEAQAGNGNCAATREAIAKTEQDFQALPGTVDPGLHARLRLGITNLALRAREMCAEPSPGATTATSPTTRTSTTSTSTQSSSTSTSTSSTPSTSTSTTSTSTTSAPAGGGTPGPGESGGTPGGNGQGSGNGNGESNGTGAGGTGAGNGQGNGAGNGQGAGK